MKKNQIYQSISIFKIETFLIGIVILCFFSCAKIGTLSGGNKDIAAPAIDSLQSTTNYSTNFTRRSFKLVFDEWISLKNKSQIIVSPPLRFSPTISAKGKALEFKLDDRDTLKYNTTYVVQFGSSIVDFTESNAVKNYNFVFSTGNVIDSLTLIGKVNDAYSGDNLEGITVMLYDQFQDSIVYNDRPYYVASTNKSGHFNFQNLKPGTFKIVALLDLNKNYLFNPGNEKIGFIDTLLTIDTTIQNLSISVFQEQQPVKFVDILQTTIGQLVLIFSEDAKNIEFDFSKSFNYQSLISNDTIAIWHQLDSIVDIDLYVLGDTIALKDIRKEKSDFNSTLSNKTKELHPHSKLIIPFNRPIHHIDTSLLSIVDTAYQSILFTAVIDSSFETKLIIKSKWIEDQTYTLNLLPGAVTDFYQNITDSISVNLKVLNTSKYGSIIMNLSKLDSNYSYIVHLMLNKKIVESLYISNLNIEYQHSFPDLKAGDYKFEIIEDRNEDKKWSSGNYLLKKQAEVIKFFTAGKLRENWDLNVELEFNKTNEHLLPEVIKKEQLDLNEMELKLAPNSSRK